MQRKHVQFEQSKGAPAGFVLPNLVLGEAVARYFFDDLPSATPTNISLNANTGHIKVSAIGGGVFLRAQADVTKGVSVKASTNLTIVDNPTHGDEMTIGDQDYVLKDSLTGSALATLTLTGAITPGVHAESVVTANTIIDGSQVTIGTKTYTFKAVLTVEPVANEVLIGVSDATALDNLKLAINHGATEGVNYSTGTTANADVVATDNADTTQKVVARVPGTAKNAVDTTSLDATLAWADTTLGGGTGASVEGVDGETVEVDDVEYTFVTVLSETNGATAVPNQVLFGADSAAALDNLKLAVNAGATEGTNYSTGTEQPAGITAEDNTNTTQVFQVTLAGAAGNAISVETNIANGSFGVDVTTFLGGYDDDGKTIVIDNSAGATQTRIQAAINGTGTAGVDYSTALAENELVYCNTFGSNVAKIDAEAAGTAGNGIETTGTFDSANNEFSAAATAGGVEGSNFDAYIASGATFEFAPDEDTTVISLMAAGASTDVAVVEY